MVWLFSYCKDYVLLLKINSKDRGKICSITLTSHLHGCLLDIKCHAILVSFRREDAYANSSPRQQPPSASKYNMG
jgi:hypothetical protein